MAADRRAVRAHLAAAPGEVELAVKGAEHRERAIVQLDCRTACNHAVGLYHGVSLIAGLRAIAPSDCRTACNRAMHLVSRASLRWD